MPALYQDRLYKPVCPPIGDTDEMASQSDRLILYHNRKNNTELQVAKKGVIRCGWVVGIFIEEEHAVS